MAKVDYLQKAKEYAQSRGGLCLATEYKNAREKLEWKCKNPTHDSWKATYTNALNHDRWCPECAGYFRPEKLIQFAQNYAKNRGGECLSITCNQKSDTLTWKCSNPNHPTWEAKYNIVDKKHWCYDCGIDKIKQDKRLTNGLELAKNLAIQKGGQCLSIQYINNSTKMLWKCSNHNHKPWEAGYNNIKNGKWCPECAGLLSPEQHLEKAKNKAIQKNGECLSTEYINNSTKMLWKCSNTNHKAWKATYGNVVNHDRWCPKCADFLYYKEDKIRNILNYLLNTEFKRIKPSWNINPKTGKLLELDGYSEKLNLAFEFQGRHHYTEAFGNDKHEVDYIVYKDKIKKENCATQGVQVIIFDDTKSLSNNKGLIEEVLTTLCNENIKLVNKPDMDYLLELVNQMSDYQEEALNKARDYAVSRGGQCLSTVYTNRREKLEWKCNNPEHPSWFRDMDIVYNKTWCRFCVVRKKKV